jgi:hypothetical protein
MHADCTGGIAQVARIAIARRCIALPTLGEISMTKSFSLVVAGACLVGASGCTASTDSKSSDKAATKGTEASTTEATEAAEPKAEAAKGETAAAKMSGAQKRTPTGEVNIHAAAARPTSDVPRRAVAAPASARGSAHAVRPAQPTASGAGARTASMGGAMAKPAPDEGDVSNEVEIRGARVSRAAPATSADGRVDNAARMLQLEVGEGDSAG